MAKSPTRDFGHDLLRQEPINELAYQAYRVKLQDSLNRAERHEKLVGWIAVTCFAVALALMFVGGSQVLGSFDPWDKDATIVSVTLGVIYCVASVVFWFALASYFSRFRPRTRQVKDSIRDAHILELQQAIAELRQELRATLKQQ